MKGKEKIVGSIVLLALIIVFLVVGYINTKPEKITEEDMKKMFVDIPAGSDNVEPESTSSNKIVVEIKGEVNKPNVYFLNEGSRLYELIDAAGGVTEFADISNINRAASLMDGQCIVIGNINDKNTLEGVPANGSSMPVGSLGGETRININTASKDELMKLSGVGESKAEAIIQYRTKSGGFKKVEDLQNVDGIGEKTVEKLKDKITVN